MKVRPWPALLLGMAALALALAITLWNGRSYGGFRTDEYIADLHNRLHSGMTREEVRTVLGQAGLRTVVEEPGRLVARRKSDPRPLRLVVGSVRVRVRFDANGTLEYVDLTEDFTGP